MVTGRPPFSGDSPVAIAYKHVREFPALPSSINPQVPPDFEAIVMTAMAKDPDDRYRAPRSYTTTSSAFTGASRYWQGGRQGLAQPGP